MKSPQLIELSKYGANKLHRLAVTILSVTNNVAFAKVVYEGADKGSLLI